MAATPETLKPEAQIQERAEEFVVPETLQQSTGIQGKPKNFTAQVKNDKGQPIIQTPPTKVITVSPPAAGPVLVKWGKGPINLSLSWLGLFWVRILKKAAHFGWQVVRGSE